ncbi:MAG: SpaA isopeptide-forming pilin-related protein [Lachnospiraceae bacterium]
MRKFPFVKRTIVSVLCVALLLTGNLSTMATEIGEMLTEVTETTETMKGETVEATETESVSESETETETESEIESEIETETDSEQKEVKTVNYTYENEDAIITISAEEGALPSDAKLSVAPITSGDEYQEVKSQLENDAEENDYEIAGFLAYDICFLVNGEEVEPNGEVSVVIDYKEAAIPESVENAENATVSVMHMEEKNTDVEVKDITSDSAINTTSENAVEKVEFVTDSFSTFTITWKSISGTKSITVHFVDESGNEIAVENVQNISNLSNGGNLGNQTGAGEFGDNFAALAADKYTIDGYTYLYTYVNDYTGKSYYESNGKKYYSQWSEGTVKITNISFNNYSNSYINNQKAVWHYVRSVDLESNNKVWTPWTADSSSQDVYMVYKHDSHIVYANLFDYEKETINNATLALSKTNALIFHTAGGGLTGDAFNAYNGTKWNRCDTVGNTNGNATAFQGIVKNSLSNNLPVFNYTVADLFDPQIQADKKAIYTNVGIPFEYKNGYYVMDSRSTEYTYDASENKFTAVPTSNNGQFMPLGSDNYHFGMVAPITFSISNDGKTNGESTVFQFSGDDDVWVFIDGKLVLDMGGVHQTVSGEINFETGESKVLYAYNSEKEIDRAVESHNVYTDSLGYASTEEGRNGLSTGTHTLTVFYVERGAGASNCKITFNFVPSISSVPVDVEFTKTDSENNALSGATFGLYASNDTNCEGDALYTASSDNDGKVSFKNVVGGTYKMKEISAPEGYALDETIYTVTVIAGTVSLSESGTTSTTDGSFTIAKASGEEVTSIVNYRDDVNKTKKIKVTKEWEDDNNIYNTRPTSLNLNIYGQITTTEGIRYVVVDLNGNVSLSEEKVSYDNFVLTKDDVVETNTNQWCKSWEVPVYYNDNGTKKIISWSVEEGEYSGSAYKYESKEGVQEVNITTASIQLTSYLSNISNPQWDHVDVKTQAAFSANASSQTVEALRSADGNTNNVVTITGYMPQNSNTWNSGTKNSRTLTKHSSSAEWSYSSNGSNCFDGVSYIDKRTKVSFQVLLSGETNYRTIELTETDVYPQGTYLLKSVGYASKIQRYYGLSETTVKDGSGNDVQCYEISGLNIFTVSALSCDGVNYSSGQSFNVDGLDFVLSVETIKDNDINNLKVTKVWDDNGNVNLFRPDSVNATVTYSDNTTENIVLSEANGWTWSNSTTKTIKAVTEQDVPYYTASIVVAEDGKSATITNTCTSDSDPTKDQEFYVKNTLVSRTLVLNKVWNDANQMYGQMRSAVTFTVQSSTDAGETWTDYEDVVITADDNWTKTLIVPSGCTYRVIEKNVDSRYSSDATEEAPAYEVVGDDNTASITVTNSLNLIWNIIKKSASEDSDIVLEGAEFTLTSEAETYTGVSGSDGKVIWSKGDLNNVTPASGTYILKETVAPAGYSVSTDVWTIEITDGVLTSVIVNDNNSNLVKENFNSDDMTVTLVFEDEALYTLPETGGAGIFAYMFGGMFLMMAGALYIFVCRRKAYRA